MNIKLLLLFIILGNNILLYANEEQSRTILLHFFGLPDHKIFDLDSPWNRDDCVRPFHELRKAVTQLGYTLTTFSDLNKPVPKSIHSIVFFNIPNVPNIRGFLKKNKKKNMNAFLWEPPIKQAYANYRMSLHSYFSKIFTWDDQLVDGNKYLKLYYPQPSLKMIESCIDFENKKFCTMIARHQQSTHKLEVCSEREKMVHFFHHVGEMGFHLYGKGWPEQYTSYQGLVDKKVDCLKNYKFCVCFENTHKIYGYVTEKIFDCFIAGCVPIYLGAKNITTYIPKECFIDRRDFATNDDLYSYLKNMKKNEYENYLDNIRRYLDSEQAQLFSIDAFIRIFIDGIGL